jgi:solute:Na+ symporter, SSS family
MFTLPLIVYVVAMFAASVYFAGRQKSLEDFVLARRSVTLLPLVLTAWVANFGGGLVIWTGGFYRFGLNWFWIPFGFVISIVVANVILTRRIREVGQFTLPDLLYVRYGNAPKAVASLLSIVIGTLALGFKILAFAGVLSVFTNVPLHNAVTISAIVFLTLTAFGGLSGMVFTDIAQGLLILFGLFMAAWVVVAQAGGAVMMWTRLPVESKQLQQLNWSGNAIGDTLAVFGTIASSQVLFQKILAARDTQTAKKMMNWLVPIFFVTYLLLWTLGSAARVLLGSGLRAETVIGQLIRIHLPWGLALLLAATFLGVMTTSANAVLLGLGSNVARDFYQPLARRFQWRDRSVVVARTAIVISAFTALAVAVWFGDVVHLMLLCFWVSASAFFVPLYGGYLWQRPNSAAALASMVIGVVGVILADSHLLPWNLHPAVSGMGFSLFAFVACGLLVSPKGRAIGSAPVVVTAQSAITSRIT